MGESTIRFQPPTRRDLLRAGVTITLASLVPGAAAWTFLQGTDPNAGNAALLFGVVAGMVAVIGLGILLTYKRAVRVGTIGSQPSGQPSPQDAT